MVAQTGTSGSLELLSFSIRKGDSLYTSPGKVPIRPALTLLGPRSAAGFLPYSIYS